MAGQTPIRKPIIAIDYNKMSPTKLVALARSRSITPVLNGRRTIPKVRDYIHALSKADEAQADYTVPYMTFMAFPGDVRGRIYEELLVIKTVGVGCWPEIVGLTETHVEAKSVLYGRNEMEVKLLDHQVYAVDLPCDYWPATSIHFLGANTFFISPHHPKLLQLKWPLGLANVQWLKLTFDLQTGWRPVLVVLDAQGVAYKQAQDPWLHDKAFDPLQLLGAMPELTFEAAGQQPDTYHGVFWPGLTPLSGTVFRRAIIPTIMEAIAFAQIEQAHNHGASTPPGRANLGFRTASAAQKARMWQLSFQVPDNRMERLTKLVLGPVWRDSYCEQTLDSYISAVALMLDDLDMDEIEHWHDDDSPSDDMKRTMKEYRALRRKEEAARVMKQTIMPDTNARR
ncbi:hypothetical protein LTR62_002459 [Meristemomyces frigidus]|uniref:Uncharacterized protein n=1 Tax=Meristemomyces frigidus TaxID=1508187 RepID=A0AAN7TJL8_9PEZI|nr:hypothetical protein LTR62_002459 [Meristemomyces frigidus]